MDQTGTATKMQIDPAKLEMLRLRVMTDTSFRKAILDDPAGALSRVGVQPTRELLAVIESIGKELSTVAAILGTGERECFS